MLALSSGVPCWARHDDDDENWITARGNGVEGFVHCGSWVVSLGVGEKQCQWQNFSGHAFEDHNCCRVLVFVASDLIFDRGKMLIPLTLDSL